MAYVTIEDVAQYLADNGYTTWADLTRQQTLTVEGMWTRLQSQYDSTRAIDGRYLGLGAYATEASIKAWVQSQGYLTSVPSPDLSSYATQAWVLGRGYLTSHQSLDDYATKVWVGMQTSSLASQVWVGNNFVSKTAFSELFDKVNIGTEQSPVYAIRAKLGLYSDSFISAGGVGSSGGSGGGGLSWANLAASTTEQIALSHLTTALSGYLPLTGGTVSGRITCESTIEAYYFGDWSRDNVTFFGNDAILVGDTSTEMCLFDHSMSISMQDGDTAIRMTGAVSLSSTLTASGQVTAKKFVATDYNSSDYLLTGDGEAISKSTLLNGYATTSQLHSHSNKSVLDGITSTKVSNWDTAYGWGNHANAGYVTGYGYRPIIGMSGTNTEWLGSNTGVILPLTSLGGGNYKLDYDTICSGYVKTSALSGIFTELDVYGTTLYVTVGGTRKSTTLPGGMSADTTVYSSWTAFHNVFTHVSSDIIVNRVIVLATSGNDRLLAISLTDSEAQNDVQIRAVSGNKLLWAGKINRANEEVTALVWMNPSNYYTITV